MNKGYFYQHYRIKTRTAVIVAVLIFHKIINKVSINRFIHNSEEMILWNHVVHAEHLHLFSFFICILCHHRATPPVF